MAITDSIFQNDLNERIALEQSLLTDLANLKVLVARTSSSSHATFKVMGETVGYQVPALKRFRSIGISPNNFSGIAVTFGIQAAESDVGFDSASIPTNPDIAASGWTLNELQVAAVVEQARDYQIIIPASHYAYLIVAGAATIYMYGVEEFVS